MTIPLGFCGCGCGEATRTATKTDRRAGQTKGVALRFIAGHHNRLRRIGHALEDRGYLTPCWIWQGALNDRGYALGGGNGLGRLAHRVIWEREHGLVPEGFELDHLCRVRCCVNPEHLEVVTHAENMRRGYVVSARPAPAGFPSTLRAARVTARLSQSDLARRLGCSQAAVAWWERGKGSPGQQYVDAVEAFVSELAA